MSEETTERVETTRQRKWHSRRSFSDVSDGGRLSAGWTSTPLPSSEIVRRHQRRLVARAREAGIDNDYGIRFDQLCKENIVGPSGVVLQSGGRRRNGELDTELNEAVERAFRRWARKKNADITAHESWRSIQESCVGSCVVSGEFFVRRILNDGAGEFGFSLQVLDPQRCPVDYDVEKLSNGNYIRHGVECTAYGRPTAYWFHSLDGSDSQFSYNYAGGTPMTRVPASEIYHGFRRIMPDQLRGLPWLGGLFRLRQLGKFESSAVVHARVAADHLGFIEWGINDMGAPPPGAPVRSDDEDEDEPIELEVEPGTFVELPAGATAKAFNSQFPADTTGFQKSQLRGIAAGLGVSYHSLSQDLEGVNYSSIRQGELSDRTHWETLQAWLIESLIEPVFHDWLDAALLRGNITVKGRRVPASRFDDLTDPTYQPKRWTWVDPRADAKAAIAGKNNMLRSPSSIIRERGEDPETVFKEIASDIERMAKALGVSPDLVKAAFLSGHGNTNDTSGAEKDE